MAELLQKYDAQAEEEEPSVRWFAIEAGNPGTTLEGLDPRYGHLDRFSTG